MKKRRIILILLLLLAFIIPTQVVADDGQPGFDNQTILVYITGSDLEGKNALATSDISEMIRSGIDTQRVNLLVMTGGSEKWHTPVIPSNKLSIFQIIGRSPKLLWQSESRSMGDAETLSLFLQYGVDHFPAASYGLVLWNHGGGPMIGFGVDDLHGKDGLSLLEIQTAFKNSPFQNDRRLEWLAFDACLMASMEVAVMLAPYAKYMVASEEVLPGKGFDYRILGAISKGSLTGVDVSQKLIDATYDFYQNLSQENAYANFDVTLSLIDLDKIQAVHDAANRLFEGMSSQLPISVYSDIARRRDATKDYGRTATSNLYDLIDLADFASKMQALYPEQSASIHRSLEDAVVYNRANISNSAGLSIYFPFTNKNFFQSTWNQLYKEFGIARDYQAFLDSFGQILLADSLASWRGADAPDIVLDEQSGAYYVQTNPQQLSHYDRAEYYILAHISGEEYRLMYTSGDVFQDENGRLFPKLDGKILYLGDHKTGQTVIPYLYEQEHLNGISQYLIPVLFGRVSQDGTYETITGNLRAQVDRNTGVARINGAIADALGDAMTGKTDLDLHEWSQVYLVYSSSYLTRMDSGEPKAFGDWVNSGKIHMSVLNVADELEASYEPLDLDKYNYYTIVSMIDTQGYVYSSELMPLSGNQFAQTEVLPPAQHSFHNIDFPMDTQQPLVIHDKDDTMVTLLDINLTASDLEERIAPDMVLLRFLVENKTVAPLHASTDWLAVNEHMLPAQMQLILSAGEGQIGTIQIPIAPQEDGTGLVDLLVHKVKEIRLRFRFDQVSDALFDQETYIVTDGISIKTDFSVGAGYEYQTKDVAQVLLDTKEVLIEQTGPVYADGLHMHLPLRITNKSAHYDLVNLKQSAINGIMAVFDFGTKAVLPGTMLSTRASVLLNPTEILPEYQEELANLFAAEVSLDKLGIQQAQQIMLRFSLDNAERLGLDGRYAFEELLPLRTVLVGEAGGSNQVLDTEGSILYDSQGIRITILESDPKRRNLYVFNGTTATIHINSSGRVKVDGAIYTDNYPLDVVLLPGTSAYTKLFSFLAGVEPEGRELSFYLNVLDLDYNRLLWQSDEIIFPL